MVNKEGQIFHPHSSNYVTQLNAGDRVLALNGMKVPPNGKADGAWFEQAAAQPPPGGVSYLEVATTMPYFQPAHLATVNLPPGALASLGLLYGPAKPPVIGPNAPMAPAYGLGAGDVIVSVVVDGVSMNTTGMTAEQLLARCGQSAGPLHLTVLQPGLVGDLDPKHSWPLAPIRF